MRWASWEKKLTAPWLRVAMADRPVLDMNTFYDNVVSDLRDWAEDSSPLLAPTATTDPVLVELIRSTDRDDRVKSLLQDISAAFLSVL